MIPPMMYSDPFYRITYLFKEAIRKHKWIECEKGRVLSWLEARAEWTAAHREKYENYLVDTLSFPKTTPLEEPLVVEQRVAGAGQMLSNLPHRTGV